METVSISMIIELLRNFGPVGLVAIMWWVDRKDIRKILDKYRQDMDEMRDMYEANVILVKAQQELGTRYAHLAQDLKDAYIMNAQIMQRLSDNIENNQFCPMVRLEKKAMGKQG